MTRSAIRNAAQVLAVSAAVVAASQSHGADADPALAQEAANWKARAEIEASKKALADSKLPKLDVTPVSGEGKVSGDLIEHSLLAYCALRQGTRDIALRISGNVAAMKSLLLLSGADVQTLLTYQSTLFAMQAMEDGYKNLEADTDAMLQQQVPIVGSPAVAIAGVNLALQIATLFRTNTALEGKKIELDEMTVVNAMRNALGELTSTKDVALVWPASIGFGIQSASGLKDTDFYKRVNALGIANGPRHRLDEKLKTLEGRHPPDEKKPEATSAAAKRVQALRARYVALNQDLDALVSSWTKVGDTGQSTLMSLLKGDAIEKTRRKTDAGILALKVAAMGGNNLTRQNFFTTRLYQSGGTLLTYELYDNTGKQLAGSSVPAYTGFVRFRRHDADDTSITAKTELPPDCAAAR